ncbi:PA domain-containing protein [Rheinheimera sp. MMS21-TC3]|uniref:PA domain-containing protein n=1 Tax=Rheinheimera sp. MMS21-TC3 TaxID=3072790 RepID=UPI0028C48E12|nr:PA domain-containing protein [Rheinheimera sp. MMS21-TC3]WNO59406.1 PA domain-containing protein [Rheinheimera sp. MMS21-TC3]
MTRLKISCALLSLLLVACSEPASVTKNDIPTVEVNLDNVHQDIKVLASDEFAGRGPLTAGETLTINYLAKQYQDIGLIGAVAGEYLQPVEIAQLTPDPNMHLTIGELNFTAGSDFTARTQQIQPLIELKNSDVIFVGYGIKAPEYQWNDFKDVDVKGKTIIVLVNDPGFATQDDDLFTGNAMTYYGRWTYKYEEAARQGAAAVFIVHETAPAAYPWSVVESSNTGSKYTLMDNNKMLHKFLLWAG